MIRYLILFVLTVFLFSCVAMANKDSAVLIEKKLAFKLKATADNEAEAANQPFLYLNSNGSMYGSTGCNRFFGSYDIDYDNSTIIFSQIASTKILCPSDINQQEQYILDSLGATKKYKIENNDIIFLNNNNSLTIRLTK